MGLPLDRPERRAYRNTRHPPCKVFTLPAFLAKHQVRYTVRTCGQLHCLNKCSSVAAETRTQTARNFHGTCHPLLPTGHIVCTGTCANCADFKHPGQSGSEGSHSALGEFLDVTALLGAERFWALVSERYRSGPLLS